MVPCAQGPNLVDERAGSVDAKVGGIRSVQMMFSWQVDAARIARLALVLFGAGRI